MWEKNNNYLVKTFEFRNFIKAMTFMTKVSGICRNMEHFPYWEKSSHQVTVFLDKKSKSDTYKNQERAANIDEIYYHI